jgi:hypothetical protein
MDFDNFNDDVLLGPEMGEEEEVTDADIASYSEVGDELDENGKIEVAVVSRSTDELTEDEVIQLSYLLKYYGYSLDYYGRNMIFSETDNLISCDKVYYAKTRNGTIVSMAGVIDPTREGLDGIIPANYVELNTAMKLDEYMEKRLISTDSVYLGSNAGVLVDEAIQEDYGDKVYMIIPSLDLIGVELASQCGYSCDEIFFNDDTIELGIWAK